MQDTREYKRYYPNTFLFGGSVSEDVQLLCNQNTLADAIQKVGDLAAEADRTTDALNVYAQAQTALHGSGQAGPNGAGGAGNATGTGAAAGET